jgi:signal peptidase I
MDIISRAKIDRRTLMVFILLCAVYACVNLGLSRMHINGMITTYLLQPLLWGAVIVLILRYSPYRITSKIRTRSTLVMVGLAVGLLQVLFYVVGGLFSSFGKSPSAFTPLGITGNVLLVGATLAGMELSRAWMINHLGKHTFLVLGSTAVFFTLLNLPLSQIYGVKADVSTLSFINSTLLPTLAESLLASLLALLAGPLAAICYRGCLQTFWWFCPILPDLPWSLKGLVGVVVPILALVIVWNYYLSQTHRAARRKAGGGLQVGWILTMVLCMALIWFAVGIFPIHPVMIATGSMRPIIEPGDVAIIAKTTDKNIRIGDIIEYRKANAVNIVHRVIKIDDSGGRKTFITKGDANNAPDSDPVLPENVVGKMLTGIPKIGWVAAVIKGVFVK